MPRNQFPDAIVFMSTFNVELPFGSATCFTSQDRTKASGVLPVHSCRIFPLLQLWERPWEWLSCLRDGDGIIVPDWSWDHQLRQRMPIVARDGQRQSHWAPSVGAACALTKWLSRWPPGLAVSWLSNNILSLKSSHVWIYDSFDFTPVGFPASALASFSYSSESVWNQSAYSKAQQLRTACYSNDNHLKQAPESKSTESFWQLLSCVARMPKTLSVTFRHFPISWICDLRPPSLRRHLLVGSLHLPVSAGTESTYQQCLRKTQTELVDACSEISRIVPIRIWMHVFPSCVGLRSLYSLIGGSTLGFGAKQIHQYWGVSYTGSLWRNLGQYVEGWLLLFQSLNLKPTEFTVNCRL